jgi:hypothetical protein
MKWTLHLTKLNTGVFDIHTTGRFVCYILSHMNCISYCRAGFVPQLVNAPVNQQVSFGSVAILVYTAIFVSAVIWIFCCICPLYFVKISGKQECEDANTFLRLVSYVVTVEIEMEISTVLKVVSLVLSWTFTDFVGWLIGSAVKEKDKIGEYVWNFGNILLKIVFEWWSVLLEDIDKLLRKLIFIIHNVIFNICFNISIITYILYSALG